MKKENDLRDNFVNTPMNNQEFERFLDCVRHIGMTGRAEFIRVLINRYYQENIEKNLDNKHNVY